MPMMTRERENSLRKLAEMMNTRHRNPFPINAELLACFDIALAQEEVDFLIRIGTESRTYQDLLALSGKSEDAFRPFFATLEKKGVIAPASLLEKDEPEGGTSQSHKYLLSGIMVGWFESYLSDGMETPEQKEFARRLDQLFRGFGKMNVFPLRNLLNHKLRRCAPRQSIVPASCREEQTSRTISVGNTVPVDPANIVPARTVHSLIEKHGNDHAIAVVHCFCRQYHAMVNEPCRFEHPKESCIALGGLSKHIVEIGNGKFITKSEAEALIRELEQKGAVHQVFHQGENPKNPGIAICNCCWDCCGVFGSYSRGIIPLNLKSFFLAEIPDASKCTGCAVCVKYCPVAAITVASSKARIDVKKCIGCGQCELHCKESVITMVANERSVILPLRKRSEALASPRGPRQSPRNYRTRKQQIHGSAATNPLCN